MKRLEQNFVLHDITEQKKFPALLSLLEPKLYGLHAHLCVPNDCETLKYNEIVDILLKHLIPAPNKFRKCFQNETESIYDFAAGLKKCTTFCLFTGNTLNKNLLEHFLRGLKNESIQNKLITQVDDLNFDVGVVIPEIHGNQILKELHFGHFGVVKMKSLARSFVWWPGLDQDIEDFARNCATCVNLKTNPIKVDTHHWKWPTAPGQGIHIGYFGPFMGKMLPLVVDAHSKWPEFLSFLVQLKKI